MMSLFQTRLSSYIQDNDLKSLEILLHSFCMGERIMFKYVDTEDKKQKRFASRAEHVSEALRQFDKKYGGFGPAPKFPSPMRLRLLMRLYKRVSNQEKRESLDYD